MNGGLVMMVEIDSARETSWTELMLIERKRPLEANAPKTKLPRDMYMGAHVKVEKMAEKHSF